SRLIGTQKAAIKAQEHAQARLKLGQEALPKEKSPAPTLESYWKALEETSLPSGIRESTIDSYRRSFNKYIFPELGAIPLDELTRERVKGFVTALTQKRYTRTKKVVTRDAEGKRHIELKTIERPLSRASIRIIVAELTAVLNHAREDGHIAVNP